jgi:hypothetical protein
VNDALIFYPPHRRGLVIQILGILISLAVGVVSLWQASQAPIGLQFLLYLLPVLLALVLIPLIGYRAYALWRASYTLQRDGILINWGLREEIIPMDVIDWVSPSQQLDQKLPLPRLRWPGAVLGVRHLSDGSRVEYLSAQSSPTILISTAERIYVISPATPEEFVDAYHRFAELGSLTPLAGHSVYPANILRLVWASLPARIMLLSGLTASAILFVYVILNVPAREAISLGFNSTGTPSEKGPAVYLLLLPILNGIFYFSETLLGLYFFRSEEKKSLAYVLWGSALFTALLFLMAVYLLLEAN